MEVATPEQQAKRLAELVKGYGRNWAAITRLIGGSPRHDLQDYDDMDASGSHPDERYQENNK